MLKSELKSKQIHLWDEGQSLSKIKLEHFLSFFFNTFSDFILRITHPHTPRSADKPVCVGGMTAEQWFCWLCPLSLWGWILCNKEPIHHQSPTRSAPVKMQACGAHWPQQTRTHQTAANSLLNPLGHATDMQEKYTGSNDSQRPQHQDLRCSTFCLESSVYYHSYQHHH